MKEEKTRLDDYDLEQIMSYESINKEDVKEVRACLFGENDGPSWHYILEMKDGTYIYANGWCDYTGWGCQDGADSYKGTLSEVLEIANKEEYEGKNVKEQLEAQIKGKQPYGLQV